ncbi:MAG: T9SS type A sorting domain-containing protein [Bacteroidales bacterium]|nr:T9SS type A sorting domain-containing protein [Bacteroidales bacterium]
MKNLIIILSLAANVLFAQSFTDPMGIPVSDKIINSEKASIDLSDIEVMPVTISKIFASPTSLPTGIACDNEYLYVIGYNEYQIFKLSVEDGSLVETIPTGIQRPYGIAIKDGILYVLDNQEKTIETMELDGTVISTSPARSDCSVGYPTGLCVCDGSLWFNDTQGPSPIVENDSTLNVISNTGETDKGFEAFGDFPTGIARNEDYIWITDNVSMSTFRLSATDFELIDRIITPGGVYPNGLAYSKEGLWYINNDSDSIYYVEMPLTTNLDANENSKILEIYPNPANEYFVIEGSMNFKLAEVNIHNCSGISVKRLQISNNEKIYISDLKQGIYFVNASENGKTLCNKKLVVQ